MESCKGLSLTYSQHYRLGYSFILYLLFPYHIHIKSGIQTSETPSNYYHYFIIHLE